MPGAAIVPDGEVVLVPLEADLGVVVLRDEVEEVGEEEVGFVFCDAVDALGEAFVDVDGFPACDGCWRWKRCGLVYFVCVGMGRWEGMQREREERLTVRSNNRMRGCQ